MLPHTRNSPRRRKRGRSRYGCWGFSLLWAMSWLRTLLSGEAPFFPVMEIDAWFLIFPWDDYPGDFLWEKRVGWVRAVFGSHVWLYVILPTVELRSKGFHGTSLIFPINWNSLIAGIETYRKIINVTKNHFPYRRISLPAGSLGAKFHCMYWWRHIMFMCQSPIRVFSTV